MAKRSDKILMSSEARVLKELRIASGLALRKVAKTLVPPVSDSYIAQIESGRMDIPKGDRLQQILTLYGVDLKTFERKVRSFEHKVSYYDQILEIVSRQNEEVQKLILTIVKAIANNRES